MECPRKITINKTGKKFTISSTLCFSSIRIAHFKDVLGFELLQIET
ncbi:hypothetical protein CSC18_2281 [Klebsiella aerogenes]|nr:hypothetical protein CSC18_2281 [Klebsiella aerogenes]